MKRTIPAVLLLVLFAAQTTFAVSISRSMKDRRKAEIVAFLEQKLPNAYVSSIVNDPRFVPEMVQFPVVRRHYRIPSYSYVFTDWSRAKGVELIRSNQETFNEVEDRFGIPQGVIAGLFAIETRFGKNTGKYDVLRELYTIALLHPRMKRRRWAEKELRSFLISCHDNQWDPFSIKGSATGAFGYVQFEPTSYKRFAMHCDDAPGPVDLFSETDAICSAANYLYQAGWGKSRASARKAIWSYNHQHAYVNAVLRYARIMASQQPPSTTKPVRAALN